MDNAPNSLVNEPSFDVVHPVSRRPVVARSSTADLPGLTGKKIALVWDYLFRGDEVFRLVKERFHAEQPGVEFVDHEVFGNIHGDDELLEQLPSRLEELGADGTIVATGA
jgi:hypothetical protein